MIDRYHHGDLKRELLTTAGELLESDGPDSVTLRGLARSLGVSHAAPGYHFADRRALLVELAAEGHQMLEAAMTGRLHDSPDDAPVLAIGEGYLDFAIANPNRFRLMFAGIADMEPSASPSFAVAAHSSFATLVTVTSGNSDPAADPTKWLSAWAIVHGLATLWVDGALQYGFTDRGNPVAFRQQATAILSAHSRSLSGQRA